MKYRLIIAAIICSVNVQAQFFTQSAEGKSSIPLPLNGAGISVDFSKTEIVFGVNNYARVFDTVANRSFYGVNISGKNSEGVAKLFDAGGIVPEGSLLLFAGYSFSNNASVSKKYHSSTLYDSIKSGLDTIRTYLLQKYKDTVKTVIVRHGMFIQDSSKRDMVVGELSDKVGAISNWGELAVITPYETNDNDLKIFRDSVQISVRKITIIFGERISKVKDRNKERRDIANTQFAYSTHPWRLTLFAQGGIKARSFKRYLGVTLPDFGESFKDTLYRGGNFGLGANFQIGKIWIGATYGYLKSDNFSSLSSKSYTLRRSDTGATQILTQEKSITAYGGKYSRVEVNELNVDLIIDLKLNDTSRILVNPYLRGSIFSRDTSFLRNFTNLGVGVYFLGKKRKFIGGFYVELPDIRNNAEKAKPVDEINIKPPFKKLSFGVVTKFNLSSVFNFENKKPKPD